MLASGQALGARKDLAPAQLLLSLYADSLSAHTSMNPVFAGARRNAFEPSLSVYPMLSFSGVHLCPVSGASLLGQEMSERGPLQVPLDLQSLVIKPLQ